MLLRPWNSGSYVNGGRPGTTGCGRSMYVRSVRTYFMPRSLPCTKTLRARGGGEPVPRAGFNERPAIRLSVRFDIDVPQRPMP